MTSVLARLTRTLGGVWPNREQALILQAIFAPPDQALVAFEAWQADLAIEQPFDPSVMRLLPLLYLRLLDLIARGALVPHVGRTYGFDEVLQGYADILARRHVGKSVVIVDPALC